MGAVELLTPPASEPVTAAELRTHLRLTAAAPGAELERWIAAAREQFEKLAGRAVLPTEWRQYVEHDSTAVKLERAPVLAVAGVEARRPSGEWEAVTDWTADLAPPPAFVMIGYAGTLHTTARYPVRVTYSTGWANVGAVPAAVKTAVLLLAAHYYRYREAGHDNPPKEVPFGFQSVCDLFSTGLQVGF